MEDCHTTLTVRGSDAEVARFMHAVRTDEQPLSFAALVPEPEDLEEGDALYDWRTEAWGTSWDAEFLDPELDLEELDEELEREDEEEDDDGEERGYWSYSFTTPYRPAEAFCLAASAQFPALRLEIEYALVASEVAERVFFAGGQVSERIALKVGEVLTDPDSWQQ